MMVVIGVLVAVADVVIRLLAEVQEVALSRPALCEVIPLARGQGDKHTDEF